jgi:hypothetical protein
MPGGGGLRRHGENSATNRVLSARARRSGCTLAGVWQHPIPSFLALGALRRVNAGSLGSGSTFLTLARDG